MYKITVKRMDWNLLVIEEHGLCDNRSRLDDLEVSDNDPQMLIDDETRGIVGTDKLCFKCASGYGSKHHHYRNNPR